METRLIYICERDTGLPLCFRCISGNTIDFSTLATTVGELVAEHLSGLQSPEHLVACNKRFLFIKKAPCKLQGKDAVTGMFEPCNRVPAALADGASRQKEFDIGKNHAEIFPLRVHSEETFRGHLFVSFVAAVACHLMQKLFKDKGTNQMEALRELRNQKCRLYGKVVIPMEP